MTISEHLRAHLYAALGYHEPAPSLAELRRTQWSEEFEAACLAHWAPVDDGEHVDRVA